MNIVFREHEQNFHEKYTVFSVNPVTCAPASRRTESHRRAPPLPAGQGVRDTEVVTARARSGGGEG